MKRIRSIIACALIVSSQFSQAQESDSAIAARRSLVFADSLVRSWFYQDWKTYTDLTNYSAIKYYGGAAGFKEHIVTLYFRNEPQHEEKPESLKLLELRNADNQWQCVVEKVRNTFIQDRKATVTSYLVGQSMDDGQNWKFIDVGQNTMENVIRIMPTVFNDMTIPLGKTIYPDAIVAQPVEETAPAKTATAKKKPAAKKR